MSNAANSKIGALAFIQDRLQDPGIPAIARENTGRYFEHITRLAQNLRNLGMDRAQIDEHLLEIFKEYEQELAANINRIEAATQRRQIDEEI